MKTERIFFILIILALILRFGFLIPGTGPAFVILLSALLLMYFPGGIYFFSDKEFKKQKIWMSLLVGFLLTAALIGIQFKLMYWPGSGVMLLDGLVLGGVAVLLTSIIQSRSKEHDELSTYYKNMVMRSAVVTIFALMTYLIPTRTLLQTQYRNDPEMARLTILVQENPSNEKYREELNEYRAKRK